MRPSLLAICALAAVLCLGTLPTSRAVHCSSYLTCADCACSTMSYDMYEDCKEGCAWLPESGECVAASEVSGDDDSGEVHDSSGSSAITSLFMVDGMERKAARVNQLTLGRVRCPLETSWWQELMLNICFAGVGLAYLFTLLHAVAARCWFTGSLEAVQAALASATPSRQTVLWRGLSKEEHRGVRDTWWLPLAATVLLGVIPGLWLYYGLPASIDPSYEFPFFASVFSAGALGGTLLVATVMSVGRPRGRTVTGYMLTRTCFAKVVGRAKRGGQAADIPRLSTATIEKVYSVSMHGDSVNFVARCFKIAKRSSEADPRLPAGKISLWMHGLKDPMAAFTVLEEMRMSADIDEVVAAVPVAEPVAMAQLEQPTMGKRSLRS